MDSPEAEAYVHTLAAQLQQHHPDLLSAENDLAILRGRFAIVVTWIHSPDHDHTARTALAQALGLPGPQ